MVWPGPRRSRPAAMSACISPCCRRWPPRRRTACANSSSDYVSFSRCTTRNVLTRRSTTRRLPSATRFHRAALTASCARRIMETRTYAGFATMERSNSTAGSSTSTRPWWVSRLAWLKLRTAVGPSATARSCSAPSPIGPMNCENQSAGAVDLGTTLRVVPKAHSPSNNRPERNENCVTYVVGLKCYLCRRLLTPRFSESQVDTLAAHDSMSAIGERGYAVEEQPRRAAPDHDVAVLQPVTVRLFGGPSPAPKKNRREARGHRPHRCGQSHAVPAPPARATA